MLPGPSRTTSRGSFKASNFRRESRLARLTVLLEEEIIPRCDVVPNPMVDDAQFENTPSREFTMSASSTSTNESQPPTAPNYDVIAIPMGDDKQLGIVRSTQKGSSYHTTGDSTLLSESQFSISSNHGDVAIPINVVEQLGNATSQQNNSLQHVTPDVRGPYSEGQFPHVITRVVPPEYVLDKWSVKSTAAPSNRIKITEEYARKTPLSGGHLSASTERKYRKESRQPLRNQSQGSQIEHDFGISGAPNPAVHAVPEKSLPSMDSSEHILAEGLVSLITECLEDCCDRSNSVDDMPVASQEFGANETTKNTNQGANVKSEDSQGRTFIDYLPKGSRSSRASETCASVAIRKDQSRTSVSIKIAIESSSVKQPETTLEQRSTTESSTINENEAKTETLHGAGQQEQAGTSMVFTEVTKSVSSTVYKTQEFHQAGVTGKSQESLNVTSISQTKSHPPAVASIYQKPPFNEYQPQDFGVSLVVEEFLYEPFTNVEDLRGMSILDAADSSVLDRLEIVHKEHELQLLHQTGFGVSSCKCPVHDDARFNVYKPQDFGESIIVEDASGAADDRDISDVPVIDGADTAVPRHLETLQGEQLPRLDVHRQESDFTSGPDDEVIAVDGDNSKGTTDGNGDTVSRPLIQRDVLDTIEEETAIEGGQLSQDKLNINQKLHASTSLENTAEVSTPNRIATKVESISLGQAVSEQSGEQATPSALEVVSLERGRQDDDTESPQGTQQELSGTEPAGESEMRSLSVDLKATNEDEIVAVVTAELVSEEDAEASKSSEAVLSTLGAVPVAEKTTDLPSPSKPAGSSSSDQQLVSTATAPSANGERAEVVITYRTAAALTVALVFLIVFVLVTLISNYFTPTPSTFKESRNLILIPVPKDEIASNDSDNHKRPSEQEDETEADILVLDVDE